MDLLTSPDQDEIIAAAASFLNDKMSTDQSRLQFESGTTPAVSNAAWAAAAELGWFALGLPEQFGGVGFGLAEEALLFREIGRAAAPGPFVSTVLAARVAALSGAQDLADEIVAGRGVGLTVPGSLHAIGEDGSIAGEVQLLDATSGLALVLSPSVASIIDVESLGDRSRVPCVDPTVDLQRATANTLSPIAHLPASTEAVEHRAHVLIASMLTGIAEWARDAAATHAIDRVQFGKPIGVNQAIKHPCADMAVQAQLAYAQTLFAALAIDEAREDAEFQALSAHVAAAGAAEFSTSTTIQVLGGMGFTHEHDAHLYVKRAEVWRRTLGGMPTHLARLLELSGPV